METEEKQIMTIENLSKPEMKETQLEYFENLLYHFEVMELGFRAYAMAQDELFVK